ncbi:MAG: XRE family transcriptional regulator [Lachnospiraceae bacterium]
MDKNIGEVIAFYRKHQKMSQMELANKLKEYGICVKNAAISAWEKNTNIPTAYQLLAVCRILGIYDIYSEFIEENPDDPFAGLNAVGKEKALEYIELLKESERYRKKSAEVVAFHGRKMKVSLLPTSAGTGDYLDDENFEEVEIFDPVPQKADFGVYLDGDSMEPRFHDGQLVWFEQTEVLNAGEIGLFYLDGKTYFKKYHNSEKGIYLISLNAKYQPIPVQEFSTFKIFARLAE